MLSAIWNNPAGGLRYHYRALRQREHAWRPFREQLEAWLSDWKPPARCLAIVGPSGGYCLPLAALRGFERFLIFEPDPLARFIFARRLRAELPDRQVQWIAQDVWVEPLLRGGGAPSALLGTDTALLFSNVVGQLPYLVPNVQQARFRAAWCERVWPLLARLHWASFHDRVSSAQPPPAPLPAPNLRLRDDELRALYSTVPAPQVELVDHGTEALLPEGRGYRYFHWPLTPRWHHLIEGVFGAPSVTPP